MPTADQLFPSLPTPEAPNASPDANLADLLADPALPFSSLPQPIASDTRMRPRLPLIFSVSGIVSGQLDSHVQALFRDLARAL